MENMKIDSFNIKLEEVEINRVRLPELHIKLPEFDIDNLF